MSTDRSPPSVRAVARYNVTPASVKGVGRSNAVAMPLLTERTTGLARGVQARHHGGLDVGGDLAVDHALEGFGVDFEG